jgi:hypothetical protein
MDIQTLTAFFMWCTVINGALLVLSAIVFVLAPGFMYRMQSKWYPISRETFNVVYYSFLGLFKILFIIFNVVPYVALLIIG